MPCSRRAGRRRILAARPARYGRGMGFNSSAAASFSAVWLTVAILAGGFARTRGRSAWIWFLLTLFLGPIAAAFLVLMPPAEGQTNRN